MAGLLNQNPYGGGLLGRPQPQGLLGGIANFFRPWTPEDRARVAAVMPPDLAPTQIVKGMVGGAADLAMQANQAMPWGGNNPQAIGYDPRAGTIDPSVMVPFATNVAGTVATGGIVSPKPAGALGIFGGRMAKTADQAALAKAEQMAASGAPRDAIWSETGWFQGADGKWRFEIPDNATSWVVPPKDWITRDPASGEMQAPNMYGAFEKAASNLVPQAPVRVKRILGHDQLSAAYPDVMDTELLLQRGGHGALSVDDSGKATMSLNRNLTPDEARETMLHEAQHAVQNAEGFARGTNKKTAAADLASYNYEQAAKQIDELMNLPHVAAAKKRFDELKKEWGHRQSEMPPEIVAEMKAINAMPEKGQIARIKADAMSLLRRSSEWGPAALYSKEQIFDAYRRAAGEVEARNVQTRMNMTPEERRATPPWATQDIPDADQIVRMSGGTSYSTGGRF